MPKENKEPQVCFRCPAEFRDNFVSAAWKNGKAQNVLEDFAKKWMDAYDSGHVLKLEQKCVCPDCESITYAGCPHAAKTLLAYLVPESGTGKAGGK